MRDRFFSFQEHYPKQRQDVDDGPNSEFKTKLMEALRTEDVVFTAPTMYLLKNQTQSFVAGQIGLYAANVESKGTIRVLFTAYVDSVKYGESVFQVPCRALMTPNFEISSLVIGGLIQEGQKVHAKLDLDFCFGDVIVSNLYSSGNVRVKY